MKELYYLCRHCGNLITKILDSGVRVNCCGEEMEALVPGTTDGSAEAHVPMAYLDGNRLYVKVGATPHPMTSAHYIQWISVVTDRGQQWKALKPGEAPEAVFLILENERVEGVFAYCNIHELWMKDMR